jgi:hypothetical protein
MFQSAQSARQLPINQSLIVMNLSSLKIKYISLWFLLSQACGASAWDMKYKNICNTDILVNASRLGNLPSLESNGNFVNPEHSLLSVANPAVEVRSSETVKCLNV